MRKTKNRILSLALTLCMTLSLLPVISPAANASDVAGGTVTADGLLGDPSGDIPISVDNFPDGNFRTFLEEQSYGTDGALSPEEIAAITTLDLRSLNISDLAGIGYFTALTTLNCSDNQLSSLPDLSALTSLAWLNCNYNELTELPDLSALTNLATLHCSDNRLTSLPGLSALTNLATLACYGNHLTSLPDLSALTKLTMLNCSRNRMSSLPDLGALTRLTYLNCGENQLTELPGLGALTRLATLDCNYNQLSSLPDLSALTSLTTLDCYGNQLTELPGLSALTKLTSLRCDQNQLTSLPGLSALTNLATLACHDNQLSSLPGLGALTSLTTLNCDNNQLTSLPDLGALTSLTTLNCSYNQLTSLPGLGALTSLTRLDCRNNRLTGLDVSTLSSLTNLYCRYNHMTALTDVTGSDRAGLTVSFSPQCSDLSYIAVTALGGFPSRATVDVPLVLSCTALPETATNRDSLSFSVTNAGDTGATITGGVFKATAPGTATINIRVEGSSQDASFSRRILVSEAPPPYRAEIGPESKTFAPAFAGYGTQAAQTFTVTNTDAQNITGLAAALSGTAFEISADLSKTTLLPNETATVSVRPTTGLPASAGAYEDTLTVTGDNDISLSAALSFSVADPPSFDVTLVSAAADSSGGGSYAEGATVTVNAGTPPAGMRFKEWTSAPAVTFTEGTAATDATAKFTMPGAAVTVTAAFEAIPPTVSAVTVSPEVVELQKGENYQFTATVTGEYNPSQDVIWSIAENVQAGTVITPSGMLTIDAAETLTSLTVIATSAADGTKSGTATVTVPQPVTSIAVSGAGGATAITASGGSLQMQATVLPAAALQEVTWSISGGSGGSVSASGLLTATGNGAVTVRATAKDGTGVYGELSITISGQGGSYTGGGGTTAPGNKITAPTSEKGWTDAAKKVNDLKDGSDFTIDMKNNTTVSGDFLEAVAGKDVDLTFDMGGGISWTVNGSDIPEGVEFDALNLGVKTGVGGIPVAVRNFDGTMSEVLLQLSHDGEFGFKLVLSVKLDTKNAGYIANLYYYNETTGELEFKSAVKIGADGKTEFVFDRASDYLIVVAENSLEPEVWENPFTDVRDSDWFYGDVQYVYENGLFAGTSATAFSPNAPMTRGMLVTVLGRMAGIDPAEYAVPSFDDTPAGAYYTPYVSWAAQMGIVAGYNEGSFGPNDNVTRQDVAVVLMRYMTYAEIDIPVTQEYRSFADEDQIADYAKNAIQLMNKLGVISGVGENTINPQGSATRAEVSAMLHRFLELEK